MNRENEIRIEKKICREVVKGLLHAGYKVGVYDGEEHVVRNSTDIPAIMAAVFSTDEDYIVAYDAATGKVIGHVYLVWGNVGDLISDYSINLEAAMKPAEKFAEKFQ